MQTLCGLQVLFLFIQLSNSRAASLFGKEYNFYRKNRSLPLSACLKGCIIPSLTVEKQENGYKPSKYGKYSRFSFCIDMCYFFWLFNIFVFLIIVRMELLVMIS